LPLFNVDLGQLSRLRDFVTDTATTLGVDTGAHDDLCVAVDEAVTNIITHGYGGKGEVSLELEAAGQDLVIRISDEAPPFDPTSRIVEKLQPLNERAQPGGLGVFLITRAMDEVHYERRNGKNELVLIKRNVVAP
jgi:serine/threonine-protein kinase RsbW